MSTAPNVKKLVERGATIPLPETVWIGPEVDLKKISPKGVTIHPGCRISGEKTLIMAGTSLGEEGPATCIDCRLGEKVRLKGGFFQEAVFLQGASMGSEAHVRGGTLLEEGAGGAHCVGLKQTILMPFATLGSLINFCDVLLAGGTGKKNHSEVGSSYIHFNFSPNQDKATASLVGDVPRGVMLNQPPIFLGGQGGLVGPTLIGYGTVIAAGTIQRRDFPQGGQIIFGSSLKAGRKEYDLRLYRGIPRKLNKNIRYIANLIALRSWYLNIRIPLFGCSEPLKDLYRGAVEIIDNGITERLDRLEQLAQRMPLSSSLLPEAAEIARQGQIKLASAWPKMRPILESNQDNPGSPEKFQALYNEIERIKSYNSNLYLETILALDPEYANLGTKWLEGIVESVMTSALAPMM